MTQRESAGAPERGAAAAAESTVAAWGAEGSVGEATVEAAVEAVASADLWRRAALRALHEVCI